MRSFGIFALIVAAAAQAPADPMYFSFFGNFTQDDDHADFVFTIVSPATVNLESWSYAGGVDRLGNTVPAGGFAPVLSLFDSAGDLLAFDDGGVVNGTPPCGGRALDAVSGLCLDAYTQAALGSAGNYLVVVTEQDNTPNGPTLADGFALDGTGNFTGGPFIDPGGYQRSSYFDFTIGPVDAAAPVPEPGSGPLLAALLGLVALLARRKHAGVSPVVRR